MNKNVVLACGLGDMFVFLTRLEDFFNKNPEYNSISFWSWIHTPKLAKELCSLHSGKQQVNVVALDEMKEMLEKFITEQRGDIEKARQLFIDQHPHGVGVDKFIQFMNMFFPNLEEWVYLGVYEKYKSTYPYRLNVEKFTNNGKPYIVVHPFSQTVRTEKKERTWSTARWGKSINLIANYTNKPVFIIGSDKDKIEEIRDIPKHPNIIDKRGKLTFVESISYIYGAEAVLGINSWPTFMSLWAGIPTYSQWFVQHQLISSHHPLPVEELKHVVIQKNLSEDPSVIRYYHPTVDQAWEGIRKVLDYAEHSIQS